MNILRRKDALREESLLARGVLVALAGLVAVMMAFAGTSSGASGLAPAQASASPSAAPTGVAIELLNPSQAYDPELLYPPRANPDGSLPPDPPKISDRSDGVDEAYHFVATTRSAPAGAIVELALQYSGENEITIGNMAQVPGRPDVWELFWNVPDNLPDGEADVKARVFQQTGSGFDQLAEAVVPSDVQHNDVDPGSRDPQPADETVELTWPPQNGALGFYKGRGGQWRTLVDGTASDASGDIELLYSTTAPGSPAKFTDCGGATFFNNSNYLSGKPIPFRMICTLVGKDTPNKVTAVAAVTQEEDKPDRGLSATTAEMSQDSGDVHVVQSYEQKPGEMTIELVPSPTGNESPGIGIEVADTNCLSYLIVVTDPLKRPVYGANVDVHLSGPNDQLQFGESTTQNQTTSAYKNPDKGAHSTENGADCFDLTAVGTEAEHNVPGGSDIKHRESTLGTGLSGGAGAGTGAWRFSFTSPNPGFTDVTAWIDDPALADQAGNRDADNDVIDQGEPFATTRGQWLSVAPTLSFDPQGATAATGACQKLLLKARGGNAAIPNVNVDVHLQGPTGDVHFCDPGDGTARNAPEGGTHDAVDSGESTDKATSPPVHHTEGQTDDAGNFVLGVTSSATGDSRVTAWIDGKQNANNDVQATTEVTASVTTTWVAPGEAKVSFVNPSPYEEAPEVSNAVDADANYHVVTRVASPTPVQGVTLQLGTGTGAAFEKISDIGSMTEVATSDTWELFWGAAVDDGSYTLRAIIPGTSAVTDQPIEVTNEADPTSPGDAQGTTVELTRPLNGSIVPFVKSATPVDGVASAGAEGVDLLYTKASGAATPATADWISCGFVPLAGTGSTPQPFSSKCTLKSPDQAGQVTGIAAVTFDCLEPLPGSGCDADPDATAVGRNPGNVASGDAHRVFGLAANPIIGLSPAENEGETGSCLRLVALVTDETGQTLADQNVDVHVTGPADAPSFCDPPNASPRRAPDQGGHSSVSGHDDQGAHISSGSDTQHAEGETSSTGRFVFGVKANEGGDSSVDVWVDANDDDAFESGEASESSLLHWVAPHACTKVGTAQNDVLTGTASADRICGRGGNDVIRGKGGNDVLLGSGGNDVVKGGGGNDKVNGGVGNDKLFGNGGNDALRGNAGADRLNGGGGRDSCKTGPGRDHTVNCEGGRRPSPRLARGGTA